MYGLFRFFSFLAFFFLFCYVSGYSQKVLKTQWKQEPVSAIKKRLPDGSINGSEEGNRKLSRFMGSLYDLGYLGASVDSMYQIADTLIAECEPGQFYKWVKLRNGNLDEGMLTEAGFREKFYDGKPLTPSDFKNLNSRILEYCENHGYPFASLFYREFVFDSAGVSATLFLDAERQVVIDSVIVKGTSRLSAKYLTNYLSVKTGDLYNESVIRKVGSRVKELPMVTELRPFSVVFTEDKARLILALDDKKASQIDGVVGVLPPSSGTGKVQVTGDVRIRLLSSFGRGELFDLNWKQPQVKTQDLKVKLNYPFLFSTPFGTDFNLGIYKKDTSYVEVVLGAGVQFLLKGGDYFKAFVSNKKSNLLATKLYENATVLPPFADVEVTSYGLSFRSVKLDYRLNPRSGYTIDVTAAAGNKTISKNGKLNPVVYDSLQLKSVQYTGEIQMDYYVPVFRRNVIDFGIAGGGLSGENTFSNELFRFGGLRTLRGFDEESLTASLFVMGKVELRYLLEENSYFFAFVNQAWYERNTRTDYVQDQPIGFGAGITFETRLGIFSFNYALGKEFDNPIRFKAAKVHFGLINYF